MSKAAPMILWCLLPLKVLCEMPIVSCPGAFGWSFDDTSFRWLSSADSLSCGLFG